MKTQTGGKKPKKIWIDLDNSPHVPFFIPIIAELKRRGYSIVVTGRDCFQVGDLAQLLGLDCRLIGRHYGRNKLIKLLGLCYRSVQLDLALRRERPALAVSHGSRSQLIASTTLRIPHLMLTDYEFARGLWLIEPNWVMVPEVIPAGQIGFHANRVFKYPGIKEDVYVSQFEPDCSLRSSLHINGEDLLVTVRPPANEAHYHNPESDVLYQAVIDFLGQKPNVRVLLLPRNGKQADHARHTWPHLFIRGQVIIPDHVVEGRNLIWNSDLVVSGGGTMNREAAALGVPVYSTFRGKIGSVDRYLAERGRLVLLESVDDVRNKIQLQRRHLPAGPANGSNAALDAIVSTVVALMEPKCPLP
jgi:uncharacterized protein